MIYRRINNIFSFTFDNFDLTVYKMIYKSSDPLRHKYLYKQLCATKIPRRHLHVYPYVHVQIWFYLDLK